MLISETPETEKSAYLDRMLLRYGARAFLKSTLLGLAPTHVARSNLEKRTSAFGVPCATVHSAFLKANYSDEVATAINDLAAIHSRFASILARHIPDHEKRVAECIATIGKIDPKRVDEFRNYLREDDATVEGALGAVGVNILELSEGWAINDNPKHQPLLAILDEASMVTPATMRDLINVVRLVVCGDHAQLPAVEKDGAKAPEDSGQNGIEVAADAPGAVAHNFRINYRLQTDAPVLSEAMAALRRSASVGTKYDVPGTSMMSELAAALGILQSNKGGVRLVQELSHEDAASILTGKNVALAWRNATRIALLDDARKSIGLDNDGLIAGEPVVPTIRNRKNRVAVAAAQASELWHFVGDNFGSGFGDFQFQNVEGVKETVEAQYAFEYRENGEYRNLGRFRGCDVTLSFGYVRTVHKAQGRQWPHVFINMPDVHAMRSFKAMRHETRDFVRWLYTAISRAEVSVTFFVKWPTALPFQTVHDVRAQIAANVEGAERSTPKSNPFAKADPFAKIAGSVWDENF
jgi:hypothetical protein